MLLKDQMNQLRRKDQETILTPKFHYAYFIHLSNINF